MHCHAIHHVDSYDFGWIHACGTFVYLLYGIPEILTYDIIDELRFGHHVAAREGKQKKLVSACLWRYLYLPQPGHHKVTKHILDDLLQLQIDCLAKD